MRLCFSVCVNVLERVPACAFKSTSIAYLTSNVKNIIVTIIGFD